jgi:cysteinyl-tRNA synthetase
MVGLITRISRYAKSQALQSAGTQVPAGQNVAGASPTGGFLVVPQNSPELRAYPGYTDAIDGIGLEELFVRATDQPCAEDFCAENLADARALRDAGKFVLAVDYATRADTIRTACDAYRAERFAGYVGVRDLDRVGAVCP